MKKIYRVTLSASERDRLQKLLKAKVVSALKVTRPGFFLRQTRVMLEHAIAMLRSPKRSTSRQKRSLTFERSGRSLAWMRP